MPIGLLACGRFWPILAGVMATLWGLVRLGKQLGKGELPWRSVIAWGCLGGLIALSSPIAGFTWAVCTTALLAPRSPRQWLVAGVLSVLVITPWAIRNRSVLGKWIPVKSNLFFEIDQSLALDKDGLLDWQTMSSHPYHAGAEQDAYVAMGEIAYLKTKQERFTRQFRDDRGGFFRRVKNRLIGATLWPAGFSEFGVMSSTLPLRWLTYPLPLISLLGLLLFGPRLTSMQRWTITIYFVYLTPYVMFSYYPRYGFPLLIIKFLLCYWGIQRVIWWRRVTRSSISPPAGPIHPTREPQIAPSELEAPVDYDSGSVWGPSKRLSH